MDNDTVLERATNLKAAGKPFALVTVVRAESPTSGKPGDKAIVEPEGGIQGWIGGGCAQPAVLKTAREALKDGQPRLIRISPTSGGDQIEGIVDFGSTCPSGGTLDIFIDPVMAQAVLLIIGASPTGEALCVLASRVGFNVTVVMHKPDPDRFPDAICTISDQEMGNMAFASLPFVVVATQGQRDMAGLVTALETGASYIAFIASTRKSDKLREKLKERGHDHSRVDAIIAPAGLDIGAVTPAEIALSILSGLVKHRRLPASHEQGKLEKATITKPDLAETSELKTSCCHE